VTTALVALGVLVQLLCCWGVALLRTSADRLHAAAAGGTLGPLLIAAAILLEESVSSAGLGTLLAVALVLLLNGAVTLAIGRVALGEET
jgi:multisubunit Na+/H+ antiporter MnhG subunit